MHKIKSKSREGRIAKRNQRVLGIILIIVMFGSVFGIVLNSFGGGGEVSVEYNGFNFVNQNGLWNVQVGNSYFNFRYSPIQVEEIPGEVNFLNKYYQKPLFIYSENPLATSEITSNLGQFSNETILACPEGKECDESLVVKNCEDNFIIIEEKSEKKILRQDGCIFIQGPQSELVKVADEFLFKVLGIRQ